MIEVDAVFAAVGDGLLAEALAELPRFISADVHLAAPEIRQIVVEQRSREINRRLVGPQRAREFLELSGERVDPAFRAFSHRAVARMTEPALHVAEGVEVRDELDTDRCARVVEFTNFGGRQRRSVFPSVFMSAEGEGVFDVKLQLVRTQSTQCADEVEQLGLRRHARAGAVDHEAADRQIR